MLGYWGNEQATQRCIVEDDEGRWLRTGDCAAIDEQGFIRNIGRIKDILVLDNGEKVPPSTLGLVQVSINSYSLLYILSSGVLTCLNSSIDY